MGLLVHSWPDTRPKEVFREVYLADPNHTLKADRGAFCNGELVGYIGIRTRDAWLRGIKIKIGILGFVVVHKEFRHKGIATMLLQDAIRYMAAHEYDMCLLYAGPDELYRKSGWETLGDIHSATLDLGDCYFLEKEPLFRSSNRYKVRPLSAADLPQVRSIYEAENSSYSLSVKRTKQIWDKIYEKRIHDGGLSFVATDAGRIVGYVVALRRLHGPIEKNLQTMYIAEAAVLRKHYYASHSLLMRLISASRDDGFQRIVAPQIQTQNPFANAMIRAGGKLETTSYAGYDKNRTWGSMMLRVFRPAALLSQLLSSSSPEKANQENWGAFTLRTEDGDFTIQNRSKSRVGATSDYFKIDNKDLSLLISGFRTASELVSEGHASSNSARLIQWLDAKLPKQDVHVSSLDHF